MTFTGTAAAAREICLGPVDAIPIGEGRAFSTGGPRIAVFRPRGGSIYAVQAVCPHQQGPLADGIAGGCTLICPLHSWKFDLATGACLNEPGYRLTTYPVRLQEGSIYVTLSGEE